MILKIELDDEVAGSVPHTGGGDPRSAADDSRVLRCSPHRWG